MAEVIIAAGSNLGNKLHYLQQAGKFLDKISHSAVKKSSIWESEPVGVEAKFPFLNTVALIRTNDQPGMLLNKLKKFECEMGRETNPERWHPRVLDLDIIAYDGLVIHKDNLIIPHPEYHQRLFVLLPMQEILPDWTDPENKTRIDKMIEQAPEITMKKLNNDW